MAGAIDLFSGSKSITGANNFQVDKNPLNQLFEGIDDVIGKQAKGVGQELLNFIVGFVERVIGDLMNAIIGLPVELLNLLEPLLVQSFQDVSKFFGNILGFLGGLDPLSEAFTIEAAAENFINSVLAETGLLPFVNQLQGVLSGAIDLLDGTAKLEDLINAVDHLDGTVLLRDVLGSGSPLALFDNGDGTVMSIGHLIQNAWGAGHATLTQSVANVQVIIDNIANALGIAGSGLSVNTIVTALENIPGTAIATITSIEQQIVDGIANALGVAGSGHSVSAIITALQNIPGTAIATITSVEQQIVDGIANALGIAGSGHLVSAIVTALENIPGTVISGITGVEQGIINGICIALGATPGPNYGVSDVEYYLEHIPAAVVSGITSGGQSIIDNIVQTLNPLLGTGNPVSSLATNLEGSLHGLFNMVFGNKDGTATPVFGVTGIGDGTATVAPSLGSTSGYSLFDNLDGTAMSVIDLLANAVGGTNPLTGNLTKAVGDVQATIDNIVTGLGGAGAGHAVDSITAALGAIPYGNINAILGSTNLGADVQAIVDKIANAWGAAGTGHTLANLLSYAENIPHTVIANVLGGTNLGADVQAIVDNIANGLGLVGTGKLPSDLQTAFSALFSGLSSVGSIITQIINAILAVIPNLSGSLASGLSGLADVFNDLVGSLGIASNLGSGTPVFAAVGDIPVLGPLIDSYLSNINITGEITAVEGAVVNGATSIEQALADGVGAVTQGPAAFSQYVLTTAAGTTNYLQQQLAPVFNLSSVIPHLW